MKHLRRCLPLFALLLMLAGSITSCRDTGVRDALVRAEALMESDPHAARAVLMEIEDGRLKAATQREQNGAGSDSAEREQARPKVKIEDYPTAEGNKTDRDTTNQPPVDSQRKGKKANFQSSIFNFQSKRDAALYALLRTQADYKCRVRLTSDSLPLIATNYYGTRHKTQRAALAQYYLGCTYSDMHRDLDAIDALLRATTLFPDTTNKYFANTLFELGKKYIGHEMNNKAFATFRRFRNLEICEEDSVNIGYADYYMGESSLHNGDDFLADSLFHCVIKNTKFPEAYRCIAYHHLAKLCYYRWNDASTALEYLNKYRSYYREDKDNGASFILIADINVEKNKPLIAIDNYIKSLQNSKDLYTHCSAYKGLAQAASLLNMSDSSKYYIDQYTLLLDSIYTLNRKREIADIENNHVIELHDQQLKARHSRFMLWMGIVLVAVVAGAVVFLLQADRRRKKHNLQLQEELRQANVALLQAQNDEQPADMDALYRNKLAACQNLFRSTPSARLLLTAPDALTSAQRQALMDDLTRSFVDIMMDIKNAAHAVNDQELLYCILTSLQSPTTYIAALLNTTDSTLRTRKSRLKEKMPESLFALFFS
ncbi:MAG: hypothetical protein IKH59_08540 [Bacteroidaceae bacterium]|nr:hypothetical protein [Bacteroidaceae bacterium]